MTRWMPLVALLFCGAVVLGCDEECAVGECLDTEECFDTCLEVCEGDVVDAFCNLNEVCECDCEFACY